MGSLSSCPQWENRNGYCIKIRRGRELLDVRIASYPSSPPQLCYIHCTEWDTSAKNNQYFLEPEKSLRLQSEIMEKTTKSVGYQWLLHAYLDIKSIMMSYGALPLVDIDGYILSCSCRPFMAFLIEGKFWRITGKTEADPELGTTLHEFPLQIWKIE